MSLLKLWNTIRGRSNKGDAPATPAAEAATANKPKSGGGFSLFGGGPHAGLCKQLKTISAASVLEVSVGDGSRAIAVLETLSKHQEQVRYLAIDQFEMAGGEVTLKQFHQTLRAKNIRPQLFPEPIDRGLLRVARTVGCVDLVLIAAPLEDWQGPQISQLLTRVSHAQTTLLYLEGETWKRFEPVATTTNLRRAA